MPTRKQVVLVDASVYIFRAWFSLPESIVNNQGQRANAVRGFATFLLQLLAQSRARHFAIAFDKSLTHCFRNELYPDYKANRELPDEALSAQLEACEALAPLLGFKAYSHARYEADDLIGTCARQMREQGFANTYVTVDKDLMQLMQPGDRFWNFAKNKILTPRDIKGHLGVKPGQVVDWLALCGDAVDNIPGVPGIGAKTAILLLERFDSFDSIYTQLDRINASSFRGGERIRKLLQDHKKQAQLSRKLATIYERAPIRAKEKTLLRGSIKKNKLAQFCQHWRFGPALAQRLLLS